MQIDVDLLFDLGARTKAFSKNEIIVNEGDSANYYHQIVSGCVKMFNISDTGKEFTQGYFYEGQSFGEPPLFIDIKYPATAMAFEDSEIIRLNKAQFLSALETNHNILKQFTILLANRLYQKTVVSKYIANQKPEQRILSFLKLNKKCDANTKELISFTRQEIANFTGLRVETVIRVINKAQKADKIEIINHKIYF